MVRGDITEIEDIIGAIIDHGADMVINMAYVFGSDPDPAPQESVRVNVMGMNNAFEAARLTGVGRVLFASSIALGPQVGIRRSGPSRRTTAPIPIVCTVGRSSSTKRWPLNTRSATVW